ncbi:MAG: hypothetical protein IPG50_26095 [Myxococcales bacterium]|nr:hypothetical protein [Myxococcales bacterium]
MAKSSDRLTWLFVALLAFVAAWVLVRTMEKPVHHAESETAEPVRMADGGLVKPRCRAASPPRRLAIGGAISVGEAAIDAKGTVAIGLARSGDGGSLAAVASFTIGAEPTLAELGSATGDDPAPHAFFLREQLMSARLVSTRTSRRLVLQAVASPGTEVASFAQSKDESLAFDVTTSGDAAFAAWDDDDRGVGVIRGAWATGDAGAPLVISPPRSDAESPRLVGDGQGGVFVAWIARAAEADGGADYLERSPEAREIRWVEITHVTRAGDVAASVRLEPSRVTDFDLGAGDNFALVLMRDDVGDARGARLVRQVAKLSDGRLGLEAARVLLRDGVGGREPLLVPPGGDGLVLVGDPAERTHLVPQDAVADAAEPSPRSFPEAAFDGVRPLVGRSAAAFGPFLRDGALPKGAKPASPSDVMIIGASVTDRGAEAHLVLCER